MSRRVLIVEDDRDISHLVGLHLKDIDCEVEAVADGRAGLERARDGGHDLIILDIMLPGIDGLEICRRVRAHSEYTPILMLTARSSEVDRVLGLELGADDYLTKPFSPRELVLRVQAILRRMHETATSGGRLLRAGPIRLDVDSHRTTIDDEELSLTPTEFRLLQVLVERRGRTQSRKQLLEKAWDLEADVSHRIQTRTVDMHVRRLRAKLGPKGDWVQTVRGFGYRLKLPEGVE